MTKFISLLLAILCFNNLQAAENQKTTICLNMIVKNESAVILRALESVLPLIDYWVIVDTGSTDGTQQLIKDYLKHIPGELHERPWVNFGHNRDEALQLARPHAEYVLFLDADDALVYKKDFVMPKLTADFYLTASFTQGDATEYYFTRLVKSSLDWHWHGVLHEYVSANDAQGAEILTGVKYAYLSGGARSRDPETYHKDIKILKEALEDDPSNARYVFYLAQSYLCVGDLESSINTYRTRVEMGGWEEEVFWSLLQIGRLQDRLGIDRKIVESSLFDAYFYRPSRIEPLYYLATKARWEGDHKTAYNVACKGLKTPLPNDQLFVEKWIYDYGLLFEYSISAYWVGKYRESLEACNQLLAMETLPDDFRKYVVDNRKFALQKVNMMEFWETTAKDPMTVVN